MTKYNLFELFTQRLIQNTKGVTGLSVALSGGVDSMVLLHLCCQYRQQNTHINIEAIYIDHGLSKNSLEWQKFCESACKTLNVTFKTKSVKVHKQARHSLEAQARVARYNALDAIAAPLNILLLGQHADDQLETFLLRLKRGSGLKGLGAMQAKVVLSSGRVCVRPLLDMSRAQIERFALDNTILHIEDESNQDTLFDRNFLRNDIIPLLKSRFSGFLKASSRSIELLQQQQALIDELSLQDITACFENSAAKLLNVTTFKKLSVLRQKNIMRVWLSNHNVMMPSSTKLDEIIHQIHSINVDKNINFQLTEGSIKQHREYLYWVKKDGIQNTAQLNVNMNDVILADNSSLAVKFGFGVRPPKQHEQVNIMFSQMKTRFRPYKKPGSNTVKHWLKDAKVPSWQRSNVPLIYYNEELVQIVGFYLNDAYVTKSNGIYWEHVKNAE